MDARSMAMDRREGPRPGAQYGGEIFGIPRGRVMDFLGGVAQPMDPRGGFFGGLQTGLGGAIGANARRMQSQEEMDRQALLQDLEQRRVAATEQSAGADVTRANADLWRAQHPDQAAWWDNPIAKAEHLLPWLREQIPGHTTEEYLGMMGGFDFLPQQEGDPTRDPTVSEQLAQAYAAQMGWTGEEGLKQARLAVRMMRPDRYTEQLMFQGRAPDGKPALTTRTSTGYSYGNPKLDVVLGSHGAPWGQPAPPPAPPQAQGGEDFLGTIDRMMADPNLPPAQKQQYQQAIDVLTRAVSGQVRQPAPAAR